MIDTKNMCFKVARLPPKESPDPGWHYRKGDIPIPDLALDTTLRRVPQNFRLFIPDSPQKELAPDTVSDMEVAAAATPLPPEEY
jgi:hypothetical protein